MACNWWNITIIIFKTILGQLLGWLYHFNNIWVSREYLAKSLAKNTQGFAQNG